jgi:hypothetical protein
MSNVELLCEASAYSPQLVDGVVEADSVLFRSSLLPTVNVHRYSDGDPVEFLAFTSQSRVPLSSTMAHLSSPTVGECTVNRASSGGGVTVSVAVLRVLLYSAPKTTVRLLETVDVSTLKLVLVDPPGTVTDAGTRAVSTLLLSNRMTAPPDGAAHVSVTVTCVRA